MMVPARLSNALALKKPVKWLPVLALGREMLNELLLSGDPIDFWSITSNVFMSVLEYMCFGI